MYVKARGPKRQNGYASVKLCSGALLEHYNSKIKGENSMYYIVKPKLRKLAAGHSHSHRQSSFKLYSLDRTEEREDT